MPRKKKTENTEKMPHIETAEIAGYRNDLQYFMQGWLILNNPDPILESKGEGIELYDKIAQDDQVSSTLQTRILAVMGKKWAIKAAEKEEEVSERDKEIIDFLVDTLENTNWAQFRQEILEAILYGYQVVEIMWKYENGQIKIDKFLRKHPRRFVFDLDRNLRLLTPAQPMFGEEVPDRKFVVLNFGDSDNPYGKGLARKLWWPVWFKKNGIKFWLVFLEKFGMPTTVAKYPRGTSKEARDKLLSALKSIQTDTGITLPEDIQLDLLEATRRGTPTYEEMCEYMDRQIAKIVLGQTLTSDIGKVGSYAASKVHFMVKQEIVEADAQLLDDLINKTIIRWLVDYNFPNVNKYPKYKTLAEAKDLETRSEIDTRLVKAGVKISQDYFYQTYGIPKPTEEQEIVTPPMKGGGFSEFWENREFPEFRENALVTQAIIDRWAEQAAIKGQQIVQKRLDKIMDKITKAKNYAELGEIIANEFPNLPSSEFQELLTNAMLAAAIKGYGAAR